MINLLIEDREGHRAPVEIPEGINLSLMEVLKASEYDVLATCGGMALCATCHVQVLEGPEHFFIATDNELDMLDTLPNAGPDHDAQSKDRAYVFKDYHLRIAGVVRDYGMFDRAEAPADNKQVHH